ncbi:amidohydrolase family protein [Primorskyibacter sp. S87]|uniref:amidohydrolase family protein n=1 Tax=Primorskyibacter sp. S87 TaxID=3415126 RepID=UPI003C7C6D28
MIDGLGNAPVEAQDVLVADGKIAGVGPTGSLDLPEGTRILEGTDLTVMPGLIDSHHHLVGGWRGGNDNGYRQVEIKWALLADLYNGLTHVFDIGNIPDIADDTRDMVEAGLWMGPDVTISSWYYETAPVGAVGANMLLTRPDYGLISAELAKMKEIYDVEMIKCHVGMNTQILRLLVKAAHDQDMRVVCDLWHNNGNPWIAAQTHLDGYAHNTFTALEPTLRDAEILRDEGVFVLTTTVLMDLFTRERIKLGGMDYTEGNPLIENVTPPHYLEAHNDPEQLNGTMDRYHGLTDAILSDVADNEEIRRRAVRFIQVAVEAGTMIGLGTDAPYPTVWPGESMHREMEIWVNEAGIDPVRTIRAATGDNAKILKIDDRTGAVLPGLEGDLLVVRGNPAENISDTRNIVHVFTNGKLVDRESLTRQWRN